LEGRITLYTNDGVPLAEVSGQAPRTWLLNKFGQAKIRIPLSAYKSADHPDGALLPTDTQIGNLVLIEHDRVGPWAGILALPQTFDEMSGEAELTAYTAEWLLKYRMVEARFAGTRGQIFEDLLQAANEVPGPDFQVGTLYRDGESFPLAAGKQPNIYDMIVGNLGGDRAGHDWGLTHAFTADGRLYFVGHWYGIRGEYRPNVALIEGHNMQLPSGAVLTYDGEILNDVKTKGEKEREGQHRGKPEQRRRDWTSIGQYGVFQQLLLVEATSETEVGDIAVTTLAEQAQPRKRFRVEALDINDSFDFLHLGDVIPVRFVRAGFFSGQLGMETDVRIIGKAFDETEGYMTLTVEESVI